VARGTLVAILLTSLAPTIFAQTSTWIAPGGSLSPAANWNSPANWENGLAPDSPLATAVFVAGASGPPNAPAQIAAGSVITLDRIQHQLPNISGAPIPLTLTSIYVDGTLRLVGAGLVDQRLGQVRGGVIPNPTLFVNGLLEFHHDAAYSASGGMQLGIRGDLITSGTVRFLDNSSMTARSVNLYGASVLEFAGNSTIGSDVRFSLGEGIPDNIVGQSSPTLIFRDHATVAGDKAVAPVSRSGLQRFGGMNSVTTGLSSPVSPELPGAIAHRAGSPPKIWLRRNSPSRRALEPMPFSPRVLKASGAEG
jgi:hypothetical protein